MRIRTRDVDLDRPLGHGHLVHRHPQSMDETGMPWAFLGEARDPSRITVGAIVVTADEQDPALARVHSLTDRSMGTVVHLELLPGDPLDYADALQRAHLFAG